MAAGENVSDRIDMLVQVELRLQNGVVHSANVTVDTAHIARLTVKRARDCPRRSEVRPEHTCLPGARP
jgi:hypothetical protein